MDDLRQSIKVLIIESLNLEDITPADIDDDAPLFGTDGLGLDSVDALELGLALHRTVHADQTFDFHRPLREGDDVVARLIIERVRNRGNLDMVTILVALTVDGEAVCDARSTLMHTREEAPHD